MQIHFMKQICKTCQCYTSNVEYLICFHKNKMNKLIIICALVCICLSLHQFNHQNTQKMSFNHKAKSHRQARHNSACQNCQDCQPVIGGLDQCNKCLYGEKVNGTCPTNSTIAHCSYEQEGNCFYCSSGFYLVNQTNKCQPCTTKGCSYCQNDTCYSCQQGQQLTEDGVCKPCGQNCSNCWQGKCYGCFNGFTLNENGTCVSCEVQNCLGCFQPGKCSYCLPGFGIHNGSCAKCPDNCQYCSQGKCSYCKRGYFFAIGDKNCTKCNIDNCQNCIQTSCGQACGYCSYGFQVSKDHSECVECQIQGCDFCDKPNHCANCYWGKVSSDGSSCDQQQMSHKGARHRAARHKFERHQAGRHQLKRK